jgi:ribosome-binding factor A
MAKEYSRTQRIGDQMQRELAQLIRREVKDPRVGLVTITAVEVSRDVGHAKIFITVMGQDNAKTSRKASRCSTRRRLPAHAVGREMKLRSVPQLHFHYDESVVRGAHLSALIERAVAEDNQHRATPKTPRSKRWLRSNVSVVTSAASSCSTSRWGSPPTPRCRRSAGCSMPRRPAHRQPRPAGHRRVAAVLR